MKKAMTKLLTLFLAAELTVSGLYGVGYASASAVELAETPYSINGLSDAKAPHIVINQVYGGGLFADSTAIVSHGFIELYNPTDSDVDLTSWSLQYADRGSSAKTGPTLPWEKLNLSGTIKAHSSYLIKGAALNESAVVINLTAKGDQEWDRFINNKGMKVALMSNQTLLTDVNPFAANSAGYVDMVGTGSNDAGSDIDGFETEYPTGTTAGTSKKKSIRRIDFVDTDNNKENFEQIDYDSGNAAAIAKKSPRAGSDGVWGVAGAVAPLSVTLAELAVGYKGSAYSASITVEGGTTPYTYHAEGLSAGLSLDTATGNLTGIPSAPVENGVVTITVTDSSAVKQSIVKSFALTIQADPISISKIAEYSVGVTSEDGGVAEIVKYNKDNGKFYLVNGSSNPPSLDIVSLNANNAQLVKEKTILVQQLAETDGFVYGDLTSVDVNTTTKSIAVSVQEADANKNGKILVLDYNGTLLKTYETGKQPDMIKTTADGRYILTADEGEHRGAAVDPRGSITIVDTIANTVVQAGFEDTSVIADDVHIRGIADPATEQITRRGTKADAIFDLEPEYITLSEDQATAYVSLQENNAIAIIDIASHKVTAVKSLGLKDYNASVNALDLVKDSKIHLENVPFYGMYMPDGIASYSVDGQMYLLTANEGDVTEWDGRTNGSTIKSMKASLDPTSAAAQFLNGKTIYDGVEVASDMGHDGIYMYGGRSFSIWNADTMSQVFDSGNDFETITSERLPNNFNTSNSKTAMDNRSEKKGPEPEDIKVGKVGNRTLAFVGLERIGGIMTYDVTDPTNPAFANYTNTRIFAPKDNLDTDTGPEGIEFIPASISPTGQPLLLVAYEVGGKVAVFQLDVTKVAMDKPSLSLTAGASATKLNVSVTPSGAGSNAVTWSSSNKAVASVDSEGNVKPIAKGSAIITATSADGYGLAESVVTVKASGNDGSGGGPSTTNPPPTPTPVPESGTGVKVTTNADGSEVTIQYEKEAFALLEGSSTAELSIQTDLGKVTFDRKAVSEIANTAAGGEVAVTIKAAVSSDNRPVYDFTIVAGSKTVSDFAGGKVSIQIPYTKQANEDASAIVVYYMTSSGERVMVTDSVYNAVDSTLHFVVNHFSKYAVGYNKIQYNDTNVSFAKDDITYLSARNIINGVKSGSFAPKANITRADFTLILSRMAGVDLSPYSSTSFTDIKGTDYYAKSVEWAADNGITTGVSDGRFNPKASITREQMVTMIVRFAAVKGFTMPVSEQAAAFADSASIGAYAAVAASAAQQAGMMNGKIIGNEAGTYFAPKDYATREETAKIVAKLLQLMVQ